MITKKNRFFWQLLWLVIGACSGNQPKKLVCIIGAGMSGLTSANQVSKNLKNAELIVFERGTDIGGQWKYTDSTDLDENGLPVYSSMYKNVRTNGPKVLMTLPDYQEFHGENRSFVKHETVLQYLRNYTEHFNLRQYIKLDTLVEKVRAMNDNKWRVHTRDLNCNKMRVHNCDAVMVCVGNFYEPYLPVIPGLDTFPGRTLHSHLYRRPEEFVDKTVVILGASYSGLDIGIDIANYTNRVYLSHRHGRITSELPENMIQVPGVVAANGSEFILSDDSRIKADALIFCTGYLYDYPFLDDSSGITVTKGKYVHPLYRHFVNINHPTLAVIGLPHPGLPFAVAYVQAQYFVSVLRGEAKLPSREIMLKESQLPPGTPITKAHYMDIKVLDYLDDLAEAAGIVFTSEPIKKAYHCNDIFFDKDVLYFKNDEYLIHDDGRVEVIRPNKTIVECLLP